MNNVYITQENPRVNILSAAKWGDFEPLTNPFDQIHINPIRLVTQIRRKLRGFSDEDWLLAMGDPAIIGVSFAIAAEINHGRQGLSLLRLVSLLVRPLGQQEKSRLWRRDVFG
jgi:hypothetical protein